MLKTLPKALFLFVLVFPLIQLTYSQGFCKKAAFSRTTLRTTAGSTFEISDISVIKYGPDGRLYLGSTRSEVFALSISQALIVTQSVSKNIAADGPRRWVLGISFDPRTTDLKMFFTTSTLFWMRDNLISDFGKGWTNGKVQSVTLDSPTSSFNDDVTDVITGLPVANGDHATTWVQFLPDGQLLVGVAGFTNAGITDPNDGLGGIPPSIFTGSILTCPSSGTNIMYSNLLEPSNSTATGDCRIYAAGFRNTFDSELHTNGNLYATDNGPNVGFGEMSTDCDGGSVPSQGSQDELHRVRPGKCHGHPNLVRGVTDRAQCVRNDPRCVEALLDTLEPSTNGVMEYRSNVFRGRLKGNLFLSQFAGTEGNTGRLSRVVLNSNGKRLRHFNEEFFDDSGLSIVEGPRGEIIMSRVFMNSFLILRPVCTPFARFTYFISVHPRRGPSCGGHRVLITGFNFGRSPLAFFGYYPCTDVKTIDNNSFTCLTPHGRQNSQVKVTVRGSIGQSPPTRGTDYWYW